MPPQYFFAGGRHWDDARLGDLLRFEALIRGMDMWRRGAGAMTSPHLAHDSAHRLEVEIDGSLANFSTVSGPFSDSFAEVEPNEDARIRILDRHRGETGIRAEHRGRIAAGAPSRKRHTTVLEADLVGAEKLLQHFRRCERPSAR